MAKKLSSVLGVDIGSQSIKVCEVRMQGKDPIVSAVAIVPTPEGSVDHTGVYNADAVGAALKTALTKAGAGSKAAVVSIAGQASVLVRTLEVPKMTPAELTDHMQWEINRNIPFAESTIVSDFKPLGGDDPNSPNMDVVMAIAPQSAIDTVIQCIKKAGRTMAAIDVEPLSMARSMNVSYDDLLGDKTVCLVDIGHKTTCINIYHGQKLLMPRQVPLGGEMITRAIADALTVSVEEAETLKHERCEVPESAGVSAMAADPFGLPGATQGFAPFNPFGDDALAYSPTDASQAGFAAPSDPTGAFDAPLDPYAEAADPYAMPEEPVAAEPMAQDADMVPAVELDPEIERLYNAIAPVLEEFVGEIRRSIDYYMSRGGVVDAVEFCGGGAKLKGIVPFFTRALGIECDTYDPFRRLNSNAKKVAAGFLDDHRSELAVAVGNGLYIFFD